MIEHLLAAVVLVGAPYQWADEPIAMWRFEDRTGIFGVRLNRDGSCYAMVAPKGGISDVFYCSFQLSGEVVSVAWKLRADGRDTVLPPKFVHLREEDTLIVEGVPHKPMKRLRSWREFFAL